MQKIDKTNFFIYTKVDQKSVKINYKNYFVVMYQVASKNFSEYVRIKFYDICLKTYKFTRKIKSAIKFRTLKLY